MSFSLDTKFELCDFKIKKKCCKVAQLYGMLLFAQHINSDYLRVSTENVMVINVLNSLANDVFNVNFTIDENMNFYYAELTDKPLEELYENFNINANGNMSLSISSDIAENTCCMYSLLRGAFLVAGYVSNPQNRYYLEISTPYYSLAKSLESFLLKLDFPAKSVVKKSNYVVYIKNSNSIERFLCLTGANSAAFAVMDVKIYKELSNNSNRINNAKLHNLEKTIGKSIEQVRSIEKISKRIGLEMLAADLAEVAKLRLQFPDKSLNELVAVSNGAFSRSALNRKLNKLIEIANGLGE